MNYHDTEWYSSPRLLAKGKSCPSLWSRNEDPQMYELMWIWRVTKYHFNYLFILYPIDQKVKIYLAPLHCMYLLCSTKGFFSELPPCLAYQASYSCTFRGFLSQRGSSCTVLHTLQRGCFSERAVHTRLVSFHPSLHTLYRFINCAVL